MTNDEFEMSYLEFKETMLKLGDADRSVVRRVVGAELGYGIGDAEDVISRIWSRLRDFRNAELQLREVQGAIATLLRNKS